MLRRSSFVGAVAAALFGAATGCAGGVADDITGLGAFDGGHSIGDSGAATSLGSGDEEDEKGDDVDTEPGPLPDLGSCIDDEDCQVQDAGCYSNGTCVDGACEIPPKAAGDPCDDGQPCTGPDVCDGSGTCLGAPLDCTAPQAHGQCTNGICGDMECDAGFGNCNGDWADGCEQALQAGEECVDGCDGDCVAGPNSTAVCRGESCDRTCIDPFVDCDGDLTNGCEAPDGMPNSCDVNGINPNGCWTAYCGQSAVPEARNFGSWYCIECSTCHVTGAGMCQWCDHGTGNWYPPGDCYCGNYEDLACGP